MYQYISGYHFYSMGAVYNIHTEGKNIVKNNYESDLLSSQYSLSFPQNTHIATCLLALNSYAVFINM